MHHIIANPTVTLSEEWYNATTAPPPPPPHNTKLMHMSFYWGHHAQFWFSGWPGNTTGMYTLALILVFLLAIVVEWLSRCEVVKPDEANRVALGFFQTAVHGVRAGIAYVVMLAVMSYNGGIFIAAAVGHAVGYLLFGSRIFRKDSDRRITC